MATINLIMSYDCKAGKFEDTCIFSHSKAWKSPSLSDVFYGNVAILTEKMAKHGALPGLLSLCPTVVPISGNWLFRHMVERIAESDSEIKCAVFLDGTTYKSIMEYPNISGVTVLLRGCRPDECNSVIPALHGWKYGSSDEIERGLYLVSMERDEKPALSDMDIDSEISRIELEMNDPTDEELVPGMQEELEQNIDIILHSWEVFERYDYDMPKYLAHTEAVTSGGSFGMDDGEFGETMSGDDELRAQMGGDDGESLEAPAPLRVVKVMANTIDRLSNFILKVNGATAQAMAKSAENEKKLAEMDALVVESLKSMEENCTGVRDYADERISGLRHQIAILVVHDRAKRYVPAILSAIALVIAILSLVLR